MIPIEKYNVSVPRYTSYPPANFFGPTDGASYIEAVKRSNSEGSANISFYLHMPFCHRLCHYCGCNSYVMPRRGDTVRRYAEALHKEIDMVAAHLDKSRPISQIHYGGGSPTAMPAALLRELNEHMLSLFPVIEGCEIAIECHPGYLTHDDWAALAGCGFNRFSIGVQDLNPEVLKAVGRTPSLLPLKEITEMLHGAGAAVNMDFLFGLPHQTPESFADSIRRAIDTRPERLVTFSYGHMPQVFKRQQVLEKHGLPAADAKRRMHDLAAGLLLQAGYKRIGLDHFVLPSDELYTALLHGQLYRNFQGYCSRRTTGDVYAFGVTGISQFDSFYAQNTKDIEEFISLTLAGEPATKKGYRLTPRQRIAKEVIERLMCNYRIRWQEIADTLGIGTDTLKAAICYDEAMLHEMEDDGLLRLDPDGIRMTEQGHPFVRNVAAALDPLMRETDKQFSKPI